MGRKSESESEKEREREKVGEGSESLVELTCEPMSYVELGQKNFYTGFFSLARSLVQCERMRGCLLLMNKQ